MSFLYTSLAKYKLIDLMMKFIHFLSVGEMPLIWETKPRTLDPFIFLLVSICLLPIYSHNPFYPCPRENLKTVLNETWHSSVSFLILVAQRSTSTCRVCSVVWIMSVKSCHSSSFLYVGSSSNTRKSSQGNL